MEEKTKMLERINWYTKESVFENYSRIIRNFKDYDKITKKKMLEEIYKYYNKDYNNIITLCTTRELRYLKKVYNKDETIDFFDDKYEWERKTLANKYLIETDTHKIFVPDEIKKMVSIVLKNVNYKNTKENDKINEVLVPYCKIMGVTYTSALINVGEILTNKSEQEIIEFITTNNLFNYYVMITIENIKPIKKEMAIAIYNEYYYLKDEIIDLKFKTKIYGSINLDTNLFKIYFYNDFNIKNKRINTMLEELKKLPFFWNTALIVIRESAMLNDRELIKESMKEVPALRSIDLESFFKILDEGMDEMPSGVLNGLTPNDLKKKKEEETIENFLKLKNYKVQENACLSKKDANLYYKIYFGLLDYTNKKYNIKPKTKIYKSRRLDPRTILEVINRYWKEKDKLTDEFCDKNPYNFNEEEIKISKEFKKGIRGVFIIVEYDKEYTAVANKDKTYMIKGINTNIDRIIPYEELPYPVITTILPFKGDLIYDSILIPFDVEIGIDMKKAIREEYKKSMKYYHL